MGKTNFEKLLVYQRDEKFVNNIMSGQLPLLTLAIEIAATQTKPAYAFGTLRDRGF